MARTGSSGRFPELFELIADYAKGDHAHQEKALRLINVAYEGPPEAEGMPDARQAVDDILSGHDYVFPMSGLGTLEQRSVDAVVRVALYEEGNREWGIDRLSRMLQGLVRRLDAEGGYHSYEEDTDVVMAGLRIVVTGVLVEELVEDLEELAGEALEDTAPSEEVPPDAPAGIAEAPERTEGAAPIAERRREVMDLLAGAATQTEVAVARAAADSYLASDPSDGDMRAARDRLPNPSGD
ncbi:MAG: hypothetical protein M3R38_16345 [Actinomycetota bacterium]|nr:hypothetical protein [Actinomycetota bacterium]